MSISTGSGDSGETSLWSGERVRKSGLRVEAYGTVDELSAFMVSATHEVECADVKSLLCEIGDKLFSVSGELATIDGKQLINAEDVEWLTTLVVKYEEEAAVKGFVITGQTRGAAALDLCRVVSRRAERRIWVLHEAEGTGKDLLRYVNRLSDLFFVLARVEEKRAGVLKCRNNNADD